MWVINAAPCCINRGTSSTISAIKVTTKRLTISSAAIVRFTPSRSARFASGGADTALEA